jgi:DNA-binding NtrC family response regulator
MATIVLVEDTDQVRVLTQSYLEQDGHQVLSAGTPGGAIAILQRTEGVDLLFTDVDLKGEIAAGIDLAADAKHIHPNLKVLYTTSRAITDGMKARFIEGSAFLQKPYTVERLQHVLMAHFQIKPNAK